MAQVDVLRFVGKIQELFAPSIIDGQVFVAYIDEDNSLTIQTENIIKASSDGLNTAQLDDIAQRITAIKTQADELEELCSHIPVISAAVTTLADSSGNIDTVLFSEYAFSELYGDFHLLNSRVNTIEAQVAEITVS